MHLKMLSTKRWSVGEGLTKISYTTQILWINGSDEFEQNLTRSESGIQIIQIQARI